MGKKTTLTGLILKAPAGKTQRQMKVLGGTIAHPTLPVGTIAVTGVKGYATIAPCKGKLIGVDFSGEDALAASDTNYITWSLINKGQDGLGTTEMLAATDVNTTKATGGSAIVAHAKRQFTLSPTAANLLINEGDRLVLTATVTGTLANAVDFAANQLYIEPTE